MTVGTKFSAVAVVYTEAVRGEMRCIVERITLEEVRVYSFFFQVQTRQWACNAPRSVTCNCGVIVRLKHHLIKFTCCNPIRMRDSTTPIQVDIPGPGCLPPGISLKNKFFGANSGYEVCSFGTFACFKFNSTNEAMTRTVTLFRESFYTSRKRNIPTTQGMFTLLLGFARAQHLLSKITGPRAFC